MRIAVSSDTADGLVSPVSHHFGRCPYFTVVEADEKGIGRVESVENPYFRAHSPGQVPSFIRQLKADVMLAGGMGRRAIDIFGSFGIQCSTGAAGTVKSAIEDYLGGGLAAASPCRESVDHASGGKHQEYESTPAERLREEADALLKQLDSVIDRLPPEAGS